MSTMLAGLIRGPGAVRWACRLCDTGLCRGAEGGCPAGNAVSPTVGSSSTSSRGALTSAWASSSRRIMPPE